MVILKMWGGLGNQMFIYALVKRLIKEGKTVKVDMEWFDLIDSHNGYELERIFGISFPIANSSEVKKYADNKIGLLNTLNSRVLKAKNQKVFQGHKSITYYQEVLGYDDVYLQGYWQSEKYFKSIETEIREIFKFAKTSKIKEKIFMRIQENIRESSNTVSLHVRRGDYFSNKKGGIKALLRQLLYGKVELGGVCTEEYYSNAVDFIENKTVNPHYYVFSDDIEWCKINLRLPEGRYTFVDINTRENSYLDMYLMSQCNHNIIANSSFSWWGAWLNSHDDKIVIAPDRWFKDGYSGDIIPEDWITVSTI